MDLLDARIKFYLMGVVYILQVVNGESRTSRADINTVLGESADPNFWPSRGRRSNPFINLNEYAERKINTNSLNGRLEKPLYVDEPVWVTMDRRTDIDDDYFWVTRGKRGNIWKHPIMTKFSSNLYRDEIENKVK
ncbi:uncharacterized protein LOC126907813 isoform X2 [Daktulosphaira vitifoliae]|uniref:uncharacterized protein LOC126907813 isoform X2 n=1 Tax=Daktulosphaira vitifoliae TaxID=58002 RepID=UPI0021AA95B2|nr:uncharacterized protein LOC126907813 isoform X2 [Daktulosphaira vitifoliae]